MSFRFAYGRPPQVAARAMVATSQPLATRAGRRMLEGLADAWGVPVSAGVARQRVGGATTFRFEGRVHRAYPDGLTAREWAARAEASEAVSTL